MRRPIQRYAGLVVCGLLAFSFMVLFTAPPVKAESLGNWTPTIATPATCEQLVIDRSYAFCVSHTYSYYAALSLSGQIGSWLTTTGYPDANVGSCTTSNDYVYCVGLTGGPGSTDVYYTALSSSGFIGGWVATTAYPQTTLGTTCVANGVQIICIGGFWGAAYHNSVYYASITAGACGCAVGAWSANAANYGEVIDNARCVFTSSYTTISCVGGLTTAGALVADTWYSLVSGAGGTGTFTASTAYPYAVYGAGCEEMLTGGTAYYYCVGGGTSGGFGTTTQLVYYSPIASTGAFGAWVTTTAYPVTFGGSGGICNVDTLHSIILCIGNAAPQGYWATFGQSQSTTTTTTVNTGCVGPGCSGGNNGTSTYFSTSMPNLFVYVNSQNTLSPGQIDNFTMKVKAVHINQNVGLVYVLTYEPATPTLPASPGNPWTLLPGTGTDSIQLTNGTSNFFIHANPQTNICTSCYYAVGLMALTTASRGSGAVGSGISFYESSQVGQTEYNYNMGSTTPAASFYANTINHPNFFMFVHETYTVATFTVTSTQTGNFTNTSTTVVTSTSVFTTIDSSFFLQNSNYPMILFVLLIPTGLLLGVTRNLDGALVGMMIGAIILVVLIPELRWVFTGLVIAIIGMAFLVHRAG